MPAAASFPYPRPRSPTVGLAVRNVSLLHPLEYRCLALFAFLVTTTVLPAQAVIVWDSPTFISGDSDVVTGGSLVWAYNFTADSANATVNGITFVGTGEDTADLTFTTTAGSQFYMNSGAFGGGDSFYTDLSPDYQTLLQSAAYWDIDLVNFSAPDVVTLHNLSVGQTYTVQIWANDSRPGYEDRVNLISDGNGNDVSLRFNDGIGASLGQYVTGSFTATAGTQELWFSPASGNAIQINAMTLMVAVPEPSTFALLAGGLVTLGFGVLRRRRK